MLDINTTLKKQAKQNNNNKKSKSKERKSWMMLPCPPSALSSSHSLDLSNLTIPLLPLNNCKQYIHHYAHMYIILDTLNVLDAITN